MPHLGAEGQLRGEVRVLLGKLHLSHEHTAFPKEDM